MNLQKIKEENKKLIKRRNEISSEIEILVQEDQKLVESIRKNIVII